MENSQLHTINTLDPSIKSMTTAKATTSTSVTIITEKITSKSVDKDKGDTENVRLKGIDEMKALEGIVDLFLCFMYNMYNI